MPSSTRTVTISLVEQSLAKRTCYFTPRLSSADGDVVLNKVYKKTTDASGDATIALPTKASGTITYDYKLPTDTPGVYSEGTFHLAAGSAIDLEDLIAAGGSASDSTIDYIDEHFVGIDGLTLTSPTDGQSLVVSDDRLINVSETYRRLDTEFGVVANDSTNNTVAIQAALDAVRDGFGGTLVFPNGITKMTGSTLTSFNTKRGSLRMLGDGGKSVVRVDGGASVFHLQNIPQVTVEGLTFIGTSAAAARYDFTQNLFWFNEIENATVRDCRFVGLSVNAPIDTVGDYLLNRYYGIIVGSRVDLLIDKCDFGGCGTSQVPNVGVTDWYGLTIRDSHFIDFGYFGADTYSKTPYTTNSYWVRAVRPLTLDQAVYRNKIQIDRSSFDEGHHTGIYIDGGQWVEINNTGTNTGLASCIRILNVKRASLRDVFCGYINSAVGVSLTNVEEAELRNLKFAGTATTVEFLGTAGRVRMIGNEGVSTITNTGGYTVEQRVAVPATASSTGILGQYAEDATHRYYCTATNTWKRVAIATW